MPVDQPARASHLASFLAVTMTAAFVACAASSSDPTGAGGGDGGASDGSSARDTGASASDAGSGTDASTAKDAATCKLTKPYATKDVACNDCAAENCCEVVNACYGDTDCDDGYVNCILACVLLPDDAGPDAGDAGVATCTAACGTQYPKGKTEYDAIDSCIASSCASACK